MHVFSDCRRQRHCYHCRCRCPAPFFPPSPPPPFRHGQPADFAGTVRRGAIGERRLPVIPGRASGGRHRPAQRAATRPPSTESVKAAALAGIAGAAEQRSSLPTRPAEMWAELGAEERAFVRRCFGRLVSAGERRGEKGGGSRGKGLSWGIKAAPPHLSLHPFVCCMFSLCARARLLARPGSPPRRWWTRTAIWPVRAATAAAAT